MKLVSTGFVALFALMVGLTCVSLNAQQQPSSQTPAQVHPQDQQHPTPDLATQRPGSQLPQTFLGKIVKANGNLVLKDDATNITYKVDNEDRIKPYIGESVAVTGIVDSANNMIHVSRIEMPSETEAKQ